MTAVTVPVELADMVDRAINCELGEHSLINDNPCPNPAAWIERYSCGCFDSQVALTCHIHHQDMTRHGDYACSDCGHPLHLIGTERIRRPA